MVSLVNKFNYRLTCITNDSGEVIVLKLARGPNISGADQCFGIAEWLLSRTSKLEIW
jgi:hypothetical protein